MDVTVVKAHTGRDTMWLTRGDGTTVQAPIDAAHDLPHLVVESVCGIEHGFWALLAAGAFAREINVR